MGSIILFLAVIAAIALSWLSQQGLMAKPWLQEGVIDGPGTSTPTPAAKVGLGIFLAVAGSLFALSISAYSMRMQMADWRPLPIPKLLWFNTGALVLSSVALQWAKTATRRGEADGARVSLLAGGAFSLAFLAGQLFAWRQLNAAGYFLATNPANTFFYMVTGLHGLHLLGGLVALSRTIDAAWHRWGTQRTRLSVELCALYWHFLLLVWLILVSLLTGWASDILVICRQLLT
jgi:cytochrome c oxidase subunit 3